MVRRQKSYTDGGVGQVTLCGTDGDDWMFRSFGAMQVFYPNPGAAYVLWAR
ncbi:MAG: hypothetical protein HC927_10225 [Deltaproteobacteria bacterium]|nr:hypothetical protein [Deltaproteobacteria bacterium]